MSMSLYLWKAPVIDDPDKARALIDRYYDQGEISVFERSEDVVRTLARIRENWVGWACWREVTGLLRSRSCRWKGRCCVPR